MSKAADILCKRIDNVVGTALVGMYEGEVLALISLLDATAAYIAWTEGDGDGYSGHDLLQRLRNAHTAMDRAIAKAGSA